MVEIGVALVVIGAALLVAEAHVPAGAFGAVGGASLALGAGLAIAGAGGGLAIVLAGVLAACAVTGLWLAIATRKALDTRRLRASTGAESLNGRMGVVRHWNGSGGQVLVEGALWKARRSWEDDADEIAEGDSIVVERVSGLTLGVRRAEEWET